MSMYFPYITGLQVQQDYVLSAMPNAPRLPYVPRPQRAVAARRMLSGLLHRAADQVAPIEEHELAA
jgi:hypothetical protein